MNELIKELLKKITDAVLKQYSGYSASSYKVDKYTFIKIDVFSARGTLPVDIDGKILILLKKTRSGEKILAYSITVPGNKQLERELRKTLKTLKQEHKKKTITENTQSSEEKRPR